MTPYGNSDLQEKMKSTKNGSVWMNIKITCFSVSSLHLCKSHLIIQSKNFSTVLLGLKCIQILYYFICKKCPE